MNYADYRKCLQKEIEKKSKLISNDVEWEEYKQNQYEKMFKFLESRCKSMNIYEAANNKNDIRQEFWELFLGNILLDNKSSVKRECGDAKPDFYFDEGGFRFQIEAKAPNIEKKQSNQQRQNITLRFTSIIKDAIEQNSNRIALHTIKNTDKPILALNGSIVTPNIEIYDDFPKSYRMSIGYSLFCALYGCNGNINYYSDRNIIAIERGCLKKNEKPMPNNRFFCHSNNTPFYGIIYSNANINTYLSEDPVFLFFQNPEKEDVSKYFPFCKCITYKSK